MNSVMYKYRATVAKVIDGDTVDFEVDLGFHVHVYIRTRLYGLDAPETSTIEGKQAKAVLRALLPVDTAVVLHTYKDPTDKYGRWLATINIVNGPVQSVNDTLVSQGYAVAKMY